MTACEGDEPAPRFNQQPSYAPVWTAPDKYEFDLKSSCGERDLIGRFHIVVEGRLMSIKGLGGRHESSGDSRLDSRLGEGHPTLDDLLAEAEEARRAGADVVEVKLDPTDGHPTQIDIDYNLNAIDDEACYSITHYNDDPTPNPCGSEERPVGAKISERDAIQNAFGNRSIDDCERLEARLSEQRGHPFWEVSLQPQSPNGCQHSATIDAVSGASVGGSGGCP
jgi:hypothetical protein